MSDVDQLQSLGQQLTSVLVNSYGINFPDGHLVFLPGGLPVPDDIVQATVADPTQLQLNPTQLQTWLSVNFDYPFVISSDQAAVLTRDESHGQASQIYSLAVSQAQPAGTPADDGWNRVDGEIAAALRVLGPPEGTKGMLCEPDNWPLPSAGSYWTNFDSTQTQSTSSTTTVPVVNRNYWMLRSLAVAPLVAPPPAPTPISTGFSDRVSAINIGERFTMAAPVTPRPQLVESRLASTAVLSPASGVTSVAAPIQAAPAGVSMASDVDRWRTSVNIGRLPSGLNAQTLFSIAQPVSTVTTSASSTIVVHLEHQCVTVGRYTAGQSWWDGVFLADPGWRIPGMQPGGLLPAPTNAAADAVNGIPVAMIVVRNLRVTGQWSQAALDTLRTPAATLGPLSLFGAKDTTNADQTVTFAHQGMQVVALLCSPLPVLPPQA